MGYEAQSHWEVDRWRRSHGGRRRTHRPGRWIAEVALEPHARSLGRMVEVSRDAWHSWWRFFDARPVLTSAGFYVVAFGSVGLMLYHCGL
jgi:hypothetical protein